MIEEHYAYLIAYKIDQCTPLPCPVFMCNVISVSKTRQARQFPSTPADILCSVLIVAFCLAVLECLIRPPTNIRTLMPSLVPLI